MATTWTRAETVQGFVNAAPNERLMRFAVEELARLGGRGLALDIGCGAGRNALPLARLGWSLLGVDTSWAMLEAAAAAAGNTHLNRAYLAAASMDQLPVPDAVVDVVIAHGIWNLAHSDEEFRAGIADAARVLKPGGALFLSTFSRHTIPPDARAVLPNRFTFTQFSGSAQCFVTERELYGELEAAGLAPDPAMPLVEHNRPAHAHLRVRNSPVILEGGFRRVGPR